MFLQLAILWRIFHLSKIKNIGGVRYILKCLHLKASPWFWVVPDDCLPSITCLDKLLEILNKTRASIVIALNCKSILHEVAVNKVLTNEIALLEKLSLLPSTLYRSDIIKMSELQSKILSVHSYPHLAISCLYIMNSVENINIPIISNSFSTLKYNDKRYS
jgi:hypothetical protein